MITIRQMAESYVGSVRQGLMETKSRYQKALAEAQQEIKQLEEHLEECMKAIEQDSTIVQKGEELDSIG